MNDPTENTRIEYLVRRCIALRAEEREAFIERVAGHDDVLLTELFERVAALVAPLHDRKEPGVLDELATAVVDPPEIERYRIRREIGRGGMGVVFLAEQQKPLRREVALKLMRPAVGADPSLLLRFDGERQALATMDHPSIARVFDAGVTRTGQPWFAMEYIEGAKTLLDYVRGLGAAERVRLEMFATICEAVHHGHQKGVIHRDLKPSNILVDRDGRPKVIDFGVARFAARDNSTIAATTLTGQLLGTPEYMSPEQCATDSRSADARSDVYALGVILYELLTERLPYEIRGQPLYEVLRRIREDAPHSPTRYRARLHSDLVTIVQKALEKDPERRYASAHELAADVRRYLAAEPIAARRPSAAYQVRAFARRHRVLSIASATILVVTIVGAVVSLKFALDASAARNQESVQNVELRRVLYAQQIALAAAALDAGDGGSAKHQLAATDPAQRGFEYDFLATEAEQSLFAVPMLEGAAIAIRHAGDRIVAASVGGAIRWIDAATGASLGPAIEYGQRFEHGAFSADGRTFVFTSPDRKVRRLDSLTGAILWTSEAFPTPLLSVATNDVGGEVAVTADSDVKATLLEATSGAVLGRVGDTARPAARATWSSDGARLAILHSDGWIDLLRRVGRARYEIDPVIHPIVPSNRRVGTVAFSPDGATLAVMCAKSMDVIDLETGAFRVRSGGDHEGAFPKDAAWLGDFILFDVDLGIEVRSSTDGSLLRKLCGHEAAGIRLAPAPDGSVCASIDRTGMLRVFAATSSLRVDCGIAKFEGVCVGRTGRRVFAGNWGGVAAIDLDSGANRYYRELPLSVVRTLAIDDSDARVAATDQKGQHVVVFTCEDGALLIDRDVELAAGIRALEFLGDSVLLAGLDDGSLATLDVASLGARLVTPPNQIPILAIESTRDGSRAALLFGDSVTGMTTAGRRIEWVDPTRGVSIWRQDVAGGERFSSIAVSPDGGRLAVATSDSKLIVLDTATGLPVRTISIEPEIGTAIAYAPNDRRIAVVTNTNCLWLVDPESLRVIARFARPQAFETGIGFSDGGKRIVTYAMNGLQLYETSLDAPMRLQRGKVAQIEHKADDWLEDRVFVVEALRAMDETTRNGPIGEALRRRSESSFTLNAYAWERVRIFGLPRSEYELAHRLVSAALEHRPHLAMFLNTLAMAELQLGNHETALDIFGTCDDANNGRKPGTTPYRNGSALSDVVGIAYCREMLGDHASAVAALERARTLLPEQSGDSDSMRFFLEAEKKILPPK